LLAACPAVSRLRALELGLNPIGDAGAAALAASPHLARLRKLDVAYCQLTDAAVAALVDSPHLTALEEVVLYGNGLTDAAAQVLTRARWPHLRKLHAGRTLGPQARQAVQHLFGDKVTFF